MTQYVGIDPKISKPNSQLFRVLLLLILPLSKAPSNPSLANVIIRIDDTLPTALPFPLPFLALCAFNYRRSPSPLVSSNQCPEYQSPCTHERRSRIWNSPPSTSSQSPPPFYSCISTKTTETRSWPRNLTVKSPQPLSSTSSTPLIIRLRLPYPTTQRLWHFYSRPPLPPHRSPPPGPMPVFASLPPLPRHSHDSRHKPLSNPAPLGLVSHPILTSLLSQARALIAKPLNQSPRNPLKHNQEFTPDE